MMNYDIVGLSLSNYWTVAGKYVSNSLGLDIQAKISCHDYGKCSQMFG